MILHGRFAATPGRPVRHREPDLGYTRILGVLHNLGHELGRNTIKRILAEHDLEPAPKRSVQVSWGVRVSMHSAPIDIWHRTPSRFQPRRRMVHVSAGGT